MTEDPIMERLARANPEAEQRAGDPDPQRDALLARLLAEPATEPAPAPRTRRSLPRVRFTLPALGAAVAAAVVLVVVGIGGGTGSGGFAEQAYAAVTGEDAIFHVVTTGRLDVAGDPDQSGVYVNDSRYDLRSGRYRVRAYALRDGQRRLVSEVAGDGRTLTSQAAGGPRRTERDDTSSASYDPLSDFKAAYRQKRILSERDVTYRGRPAVELRVDTSEGAAVPESEITYVFDRETKLPLRQSGGSTTVLDGESFRADYDVTYDVVERLPRSAQELDTLRFGAP